MPVPSEGVGCLLSESAGPPRRTITVCGTVGNLLLSESDLFFLRSASLRRMLLVLLVETVSDAAGLVGRLLCIFFLVGLSFGVVLPCFTHVLILLLPGLWLSWVMF